MKFKIGSILLAIGLTQIAQASSYTTTNMQVNTTLSPMCQIVTTSNISFGELTINPTLPSQFGLGIGQHMSLKFIISQIIF